MPDPRGHSTTLDRIAGWAARQPARLAIADGNARIGFGALHGLVMRFAHLFHEAGIARGDRVAISQPGFAVEMVATLACECLGAVPASFSSENDADAGALFARVAWVLSERPQALPHGVCSILLDQGFVTRSATVDSGAFVAPGVPLRDEEPQRLLRTSGSTGRARWMLLSRAAQEARLRIHERSRRFDTAATLIAAPFVVNAGLLHAMACLRQGSPIAHGRLPDLRDVAIGTFWGMPLHLERFLAELEGGPSIARPVDVRLVGGFVSPQLREKAARALGGDIANPYGTNEVGIVCDSLDDAGEGEVLPGIDVRILDPAGHALPVGGEGAIAVRAPGAVAGYEDEPQATAAAFRDGWFLTGDHGVLVAPRRLRIEGRHDDLVPLGGRKVPARAIEDGIRSIAGVMDVAVCALRADADGAALGVAVVGDGSATPDAIAAGIASGLDRSLATLVRFRFVAALPRTLNGKVDRVALGRLFS